MNANLKKLLEQYPDSDLRALVLSLYGSDKEIDDRIETALLASDSAALFKHLKKQVQSLSRGSRFIPYRESFGFSRTIDQLTAQIKTLLPDDPQGAFKLTDLLMATSKKVFNRCDDSGGSIGESYQSALQLWLEAAAAWQAGDQPCKLDWSAEVLKRYGDNDYAVWDYLIPGSLVVLGEPALRELATLFEADCKRLGLTGDDGVYNADLANAELGLRSVAQALGDVALFEYSYLLNKPEPNELQKIHIAEFCLAQADAESALRWLAEPWEARFAKQQQSLIDNAYVMLGRSDDLLALRQQAYAADPGFGRLQALLKIAPEEQQKSILAEAVSRAGSSANISVAVDTMIKLQNPDAASAYVLQHPERLEEVGYYQLADWAVVFVENGMHLAAVLIYRRLLLDILQEGRTTAYRHAAKYYRALQSLDSNLSGYESLTDKAEFDRLLQDQHGRKRSFWSLVS